MTFEMYGLRLIDSGVSSLIENMAILFVPLYVAVLTVINPLTASIMGIIFAHELLSPLKIAGYIIILSTLYIYNSRLGEKNK